MSRSPAAGPSEGGIAPVVTLQLSLAESVDADRVPDVLGSGDASWLGEAMDESRPGWRSFLCDLELHAGGSGPTLFRKAAVVSFGEATSSEQGWRVPIEWRAASMTPLFPVFVGHLRIDPEGIRLDGRYAPPGGRIGYLLDVTLLGMAARQTGRWFMRRLADALA